MLLKFTEILLKNRWYALLIIFLATFIPFVGTIAVLIAAFITLRKGTLEGAIAFFVATLPYVIGYFIFADKQAFVLYSLAIFVLSNFLMWLMAVILRVSNNWSEPLQLISLLCIVTICLLHLAYPTIGDWWVAQLNAYFAHASMIFDVLSQQPISSAMQAEMIGILQRYATGILAGFIIINAILQLSIARWWQNTIFSPGHIKSEMQNIRLSHLAGSFFLVCLLLAYLENTVILDIIPVVYLAFCLAGISIMHKMIMQKRRGLIGLILFYVLTILLMPFSIMFIALIGLLDVWFDFRNRLKERY